MDAPPRNGFPLSPAARVVVLGAGGFIGRALSARLAARGIAARALTRADTGALSAANDWPVLLDGAEIVIHAATSASPRHDLGRFASEVAAAEALARAAARCGIRRLILMSSIRAMGEESHNAPFRADMRPAPTDDYGRAKLAIEQATAGAPGLTILRPPLVYGPQVGGGMRAFLASVARGLPLPVASIRNRRAYLFMDNLLDMFERLLAEDAPSGIYLLRDNEEISTPELARRIARQMNRTARLFPCPTGLLRAGLSAAGRGDIARTLIDTLSIDDASTRARLGWRPRISLDDGLAATCGWFREVAR